MCIIQLLKLIPYIKGDFIMGIAFHKKTNKTYIQYTIRIEGSILDRLRDIASREDLSINEVINQSLQFVIDDYDKKNKQ